MDIQLNFNKSEISLKVTKFLAANLPNDEDKKSILRIEKCNKLNYMDANSLIQAILKAFTIDDGEEDIPIGTQKVNELPVVKFYFRTYTQIMCYFRCLIYLN